MQTLVHTNQSNGDSHKEQNKQRKTGSFGLPSLGEGDFYLGKGPVGLKVMTSGFQPQNPLLSDT